MATTTLFARPRFCATSPATAWPFSCTTGAAFDGWSVTTDSCIVG